VVTGEMSWIKPNGEAGDGNTYDGHAEVAKALRCRLQPFDVYQGPYIDTKRGKLFLSSEDGLVGQATIWVNGEAPAYRPPIVEDYFPCCDWIAALEAARRALKRARTAS
jgi:hypothetical protein